MAQNILDPSAVLSRLPNLLPTTSRSLSSPQDAVVALFHAALTNLAFRLVGTDESSAIQSYENNALPEGWNAHGPGHYALRYKHEQSSLEFLVKVTKLGTRTMVNAIALESDKAASLDIPTNDFTSPSFFPHDLSAADAPPLVHGFIASNRVADLLSLFKVQIVQKLVPGLRKEGYTEDSTNTSTNAGDRAPPPGRQPAPAQPRPNAPPEPPYIPGQPYSHIPPQNPLEIGRRDRDPFPAGVNPFAPPPLFPGASGDGMFVGPNHPMFGPRRGGMGSPFGGEPTGPWGGDGYLPPLGAPPGARFDPVGPSLGPGFPGRGQPLGRGMPGFGNLRDPDNDDFMPPGAGDMYS
ncbi:hypothetical protein PUNSTDRAFT_142546 [Punctularia strigosozonata HHB-11173 SS5]|uniref:uncharacterized protein n=1 Tax=Punctularia strigosozonata (strain HHB-11173) TaxID=741275 RepID=UPI0004417A62|nr:uncharacterized protein PUNSTDRAFT_142546 [Punctularia strigosozonata HHB-11173 SS5]EIN10560.1 hypothetical protein PUNSTDRAFT_142546 [Punctularia strigosozonata HHB-11173 SS5]